VQDHWEIGITSAEVSDIGMRRTNNQDSYVTVLAKSRDRFNSHGHLFVVADGMGAHAAGELASQLATESISRNYFRLTSVTEKSFEGTLRDANREIYTKGQSNPEFHNMGTTASALILKSDGALIAHVGDSRVYRLRNDCLEQLTFDHSLVWEIETNPEIQANSWNGPIPKNVITRSLGPNPNVEIDIEGPFQIEESDRFILCSDGLTGVVDDEEIGTLVSCLSAEDAAQVLVDLANLRGGPDNITVTVVNVGVKANELKHSLHLSETSGKQNMPAWPSYAALLAILLTAFFAFLTITVARQPFLGLSMILSAASVCLGSICLFDRWKAKKKNNVETKIPRGKAPYRSYDARPSKELYERLGDTVAALRDASTEHNWLMEWDRINQYQEEGQKNIQDGKADLAIHSQSHAIIEAMKQLREQQDRAANDTSIDL